MLVSTRYIIFFPRSSNSDAIFGHRIFKLCEENVDLLPFQLPCCRVSVEAAPQGTYASVSVTSVNDRASEPCGCKRWVCSKSFAGRRFRLIHARAHSTIYLRGNISIAAAFGVVKMCRLRPLTFLPPSARVVRLHLDRAAHRLLGLGGGRAARLDHLAIDAATVDQF